MPLALKSIVFMTDIIVLKDAFESGPLVFRGVHWRSRKAWMWKVPSGSPRENP